MSDSVRPRRQQPTRLPRPWNSPGKNTGVGCHFLLQCMKVKSESEVAQLCSTLSDPMDCSPPGSSIHGIFQARVLEWGAIAFSSTYYKATLIKTHGIGEMINIRISGPELIQYNFWLLTAVPRSFPGGASGKESACQCRRRKDVGSIPGSGRSPGGRYGNPLQYSCLENSMDRGVWQAPVHRVTQSRKQLKQLSTHQGKCNEKRKVFHKWFWITKMGYLYCEKWILTLILIPNRNINSSIDLNAQAKSTK